MTNGMNTHSLDKVMLTLILVFVLAAGFFGSLDIKPMALACIADAFICVFYFIARAEA